MQHAWAEIEHGLGYKAKEEIPREARRRFSRLAGLLEVGDTEFSGIRDYIREYRTVVLQKVDEYPSGVPIDGTSLDAYFRTDAAAVELDAQLAAMLGASVVEGLSYNHILSVSLPYFGIETISRLRSALNEHRDTMFGYLRVAHNRRFYGDVRISGHGYSGLVLCYVLVARNRAAAEIVDWLALVGVGGTTDRPATAQAMVSMYSQAISERQDP